MASTNHSSPLGSGSDGQSDVNSSRGDAEAMTNGHTETENTVSTRMKIVGVNCNLMPKGALSLLTTGDLKERAADLADFLVGKLPRKRGGVFDSGKGSGNESEETSADESEKTSDKKKVSKSTIQNDINPPGDIIFLQEQYDPDSRGAIFRKFRKAGYIVCEGPNAGNYPQKGEPSNGFQRRFYKHHSGEAVFVRKELWGCGNVKGGSVIPGTEHSRGGEVKSDEPTRDRARSTPSPQDLSHRRDVNSATPMDTANSSSSSGGASGLTFRVLGFKSYAFPDSNVHGCNALESHVPKGIVWVRIGLWHDTNSGGTITTSSSSSGSSISSSSSNSTGVTQAATLQDTGTTPLQAPRPLLFLDAFFTHLQSCPLSYLYWFSPQKQRMLQLQCIKKIMKQISVERPRKGDKQADERGNKKTEEVEEVQPAATAKNRTETRRTENRRTNPPTPVCGSLLMGDLNICADWTEFTNLKALLKLKSTNGYAMSNFDDPDGPGDSSKKFKAESENLKESEPKPGKSDSPKKTSNSSPNKEPAKSSKTSKSRTSKSRKKEHAKPPFPEIWNPLVTVGNPKNTSHLPFVWKIGGFLYDHYKSQLDHILVSEGILEGKGWGVKEGRDDGANDGEGMANGGGELGELPEAGEVPEGSEVSPDQVKVEASRGDHNPGLQASTRAENMRVFHLSKDGISLTDHEGISIELVGELRNI